VRLAQRLKEGQEAKNFLFLAMNTVVNPPGWQAKLNLEYGLRGNTTRLVNKSQCGPLALQRSFYPEGDICHNYILHPPGGVVGGDTLEINVQVHPGAHALLTTPGATKFYRSKSGQVGRQSQNIIVDDNAVIEWLPQQNIFFPGAHSQLTTEIDIAANGKFIGWELHCFGRPANDENFATGTVRSKTRVNIAGELRLIEQLNTQGDDTLRSATGLRDLPMQGSLIAAPCSDVDREVVEQLLLSFSDTEFLHPFGLTLVDEVLVLRALGEQAEPMLALFTKVWTALRLHWLQREPCMPRIWAT
jgi:urease accessory protein